MRVILFAHPPHFPRGWSKIYVGRMDDLAGKITHKDRSEYIGRHRSWGALKGWLARISGDKCWYCEAKSSRAPLDVDHFRPKLGITIDGTILAGDTGYYWLAYEWSNFRLSCQRCNRPEGDESDVVRGKANEFPLRDELTRCTAPDGTLENETPRFLDPCNEEDCVLLAHGIDGEVKSAAKDGTWEFERAEYTIRRLGLNAFNTPETRKRSWRLLDDLINLAGDQPEVAFHIKQHLSSAQEYSSFFRSAIGSHRDKPWIEALL